MKLQYTYPQCFDVANSVLIHINTMGALQLIMNINRQVTWCVRYLHDYLHVTRDQNVLLEFCIEQRIGN